MAILHFAYPTGMLPVVGVSDDRPVREFRPDSNDAVAWRPGKLWSLWEMLNNWAYFYLHIGLGLGWAELDLKTYRKQEIWTAGLAGTEPTFIEASNPIVDALYQRCEQINSSLPYQDFGAIPGKVASLQAKILSARKNPLAKGKLAINELIDDVEHIKNDFMLILSKRHYYYITPELFKNYGKPDLFGEKVTKKFPKARDDIERGGKLLGSR
jgi:hypothetical protein